MIKYRYPGLQPFSRNEAMLFFGRDADAERLSRLVRLEKLVVLFGKSGYGKSSLVQAAVLPRLEQDTDICPITIRFYGYNPQALGVESPLERTVTQLRSLVGESSGTVWLDDLLPEENSLWYYLKKVQAATDKRRFLLVFDQFEELFTYPESVTLPFRAQLAELLYVQIPQSFRDAYNRNAPDQLEPANRSLFFTDLDVRVLFAIRSDHMHRMNRLKDYLPNVLRHCYELDALTLDQAQQAIEKPALQEASGFTPAFTYNPDALHLILDYLSKNNQEKIETFQLQLVCRHIEDQFVRGQGNVQIEPANFGPDPASCRQYLEDINRNYYLSCVAKLPADQQQVARKIVENELVTVEDKRRVNADGGMLVSRYRADGASAALLEALKSTYLLRSETTERGTTFELSHDALIEPILKARIEREVAEERRAMTRRMRRFILLGVAILAVAISALLFGVWALAQKKEADHQRTEADSQRELAEEALQKFNIEQAAREKIQFQSKKQDALNFAKGGYCPQAKKTLEDMKDITLRHPELNKEWNNLNQYLGGLCK